MRPILADNCYSCHGDKNQKAGLRLDIKADALKGADAGPVILPKYKGKDKTFWSFNWEGTQQTQENVVQASGTQFFPAAFRNGDFSALLHPAVEVTVKVFEAILGLFFVLSTAAYWIFERERAMDFVTSLLPRPRRKRVRDTWDLIDLKLGAKGSLRRLEADHTVGAMGFDVSPELAPSAKIGHLQIVQVLIIVR